MCCTLQTYDLMEALNLPRIISSSHPITQIMDRLGVMMETAAVRVHYCSLVSAACTSVKILHPVHCLLSFQNCLCFPLLISPQLFSVGLPWRGCQDVLHVKTKLYIATLAQISESFETWLNPESKWNVSNQYLSPPRPQVFV